jgi:nucleoside-triphosphatase THEP1
MPEQKGERRNGPTWLLILIGFISLAIQAYAGGLDVGGARIEPSPLLAGIASAIVLFYLYLTEPGTLRMVGNWRFWATGLILAGLSGLVLGKTRTDIFGIPVSIDGLKAGIIVVFRASILISLIMALSKRISPDWLVRQFARAGLPQAGGAFALGVELLPHMVTSWRNELHQENSETRIRLFDRMARLVVAASDLADEIVRDLNIWTAPRKVAQVFIVSGPVGSGKTSLLREVIERLEQTGHSVGGFIQPAFLDEKGRRNGYNLELLPESVTIELARESKDGISRWIFEESAFQRARTHLEAQYGADVFLVDEIGRVERTGGGHWPVLARCLPARGGIWVLVVRQGMERNVLARLGYAQAVTIHDPTHKKSREVFIEALLAAVCLSSPQSDELDS